MSVRLSSLLVVLVPFLTAPAGAQPAAEVPVRSVTLFSSGVGYFEHDGRVEGDRTVTLHFDEAQIDDALQSLVALDHGGGTVRAVHYPADAPLERTLGSFEVNLAAAHSLGALLRQMRGREVIVRHGGRTLRGPLVAVAEEDAGTERGRRWWLTVLDGGALRRLALDEVEAVEPVDGSLQRELEAALAALAGAQDRARKPVTVHFEGRGARRVGIGYVVETPVWKTTYRLLLPETDGPAFLQGWAVVENQTEADWRDVAVHLVSGRPVSFVTPLYEPLYLDRPEVPLPTHAALRPRRHDEGVALPDQRLDLNARLDLSDDVVVTAEAPAARYAGQAVSREALRRSAEAVGEAGDVGRAFEYRLGRVTLPRGQSALLPIVTHDVAARPLSLYDAREDRTHPRLGARVTNTTDRFLSAGPATLFEGGTYAGDAMLPDLPPGDDRLLTYALDLRMTVQEHESGEARRVESARIVEGALHVEEQLRRTRRFVVENEAARPRTLLLEVPREPAWTLTDETAAPVEQTDDAWRFEVEVAAGTTVPFEVRSTRPVRRTFALVELASDVRFRYRDSDELPADVREALERAAELQRERSVTEGRVQRIREQLTRLVEQEQPRLRENMQAVDRDSDYYRRLLGKLEAQEDEIERMQQTLAKLEREAAAQQRALERYVGGLRIP